MFYLRRSYRRARRIQQQFTHFEWAILTVVALILIALAYGMAMKAVPYEPYSASSYSILPDEVCSRATVRVETVNTVEITPYAETLIYESYWEAENGTIIASEAGRLDISPHPQETSVSPIFRGVPNRPGKYELVKMIEVEGSVGGIPRTQTLTVRSDDSLVVHAPGEAGCPELVEEAG